MRARFWILLAAFLLAGLVGGGKRIYDEGFEDGAIFTDVMWNIDLHNRKQPFRSAEIDSLIDWDRDRHGLLTREEMRLALVRAAWEKERGR